jgi:hypothetical protein
MENHELEILNEIMGGRTSTGVMAGAGNTSLESKNAAGSRPDSMTPRGSSGCPFAGTVRLNKESTCNPERDIDV